MDGAANLGVMDVRAEPPVVTAHPLLLTPDMALRDAFRVALLECQSHIAGNLAAVMQNRDAEALHQVRVGLRRLRIALASFATDPVLDEYALRTKSFFDATGPARDLDVFLTELFEPVVAEFGAQQGFAILRARAELARARAWDIAVAQVSGAEFASFLDEAASKAGQWGDDPLQPQVSVLAHAPIVLGRQLARVLKRGRGLKAMQHDGYHRLRIALKKLRYTSEFYASLYKERSVQRYLGEIKKLQDLLGSLNDAAQVRAALGRLMMEETESAQVQADLSFAAGLINGWHHANAGRLTRKARKCWRTLKQTEPFWA